MTPSNNANNHTPDAGEPPPHLAQDWLYYEEHTALTVYSELKKALLDLGKNANAKNVHESRVLLRRWNSVWKVLKADGWRSRNEGKYLESQLKTLSGMLGNLRDCDVNIEITESLGAGKRILNKWKYDREVLARKTRKYLQQLDTKKLMKRLKRFLQSRPKKLRQKLEGRQESAYDHLEKFVVRQEELSRQLALNAQEPPELHKLRLSIKAWRYLLVEFYGLTNLELVRAQQLLGKLNDLHRISLLLAPYEKEFVEEPLNKLIKQQNKLLAEFEEIRTDLPFGLRPRVLTHNSPSKTDLKL